MILYEIYKEIFYCGKPFHLITVDLSKVKELTGHFWMIIKAINDTGLTLMAKCLIVGEITQTCFSPSSNHINKMHLKIWNNFTTRIAKNKLQY
jgi:hypothetical protein